MLAKNLGRSIVIGKSIFFSFVLALVTVCAAQTGLDTLTAKIYQNPGDAYDGESDAPPFGSLIGWKLEVSSQLPPAGDISYARENLNDELSETAWVEGKSDYGIGEYIIFSFPRSVFGTEELKIDSANFYAFRLLNGYCKNRKAWQDNSRVKTMKLYFDDIPLAVIDLVDTSEVQYFRFDKIWVKPNDFFKLEILDIYPGTKYKDTGLSELWAMGDF